MYEQITHFFKTKININKSPFFPRKSRTNHHVCQRCFFFLRHKLQSTGRGIHRLGLHPCMYSLLVTWLLWGLWVFYPYAGHLFRNCGQNSNERVVAYLVKIIFMSMRGMVNWPDIFWSNKRLFPLVTCWGLILSSTHLTSKILGCKNPILRHSPSSWKCKPRASRQKWRMPDEPQTIHACKLT